MPNSRRPRLRALHAPPPTVALTVGLGLAYLATLAAFALAFERPSPIGWVGFAIVAAVVLGVTLGAGTFFSRTRR